MGWLYRKVNFAALRNHRLNFYRKKTKYAKPTNPSLFHEAVFLAVAYSHIQKINPHARRRTPSGSRKVE